MIREGGMREGVNSDGGMREGVWRVREGVMGMV